MLTVDNLSVRAGRKGPQLVHDLGFRLVPGEFLAVLGPNGSGKSTMLKAIGGELPMQQGGSVAWKQKPMHGYRLLDLATERAFLDQHTEVPFSFTAREVVLMGRYPYFTGLPDASDTKATDKAMQRLDVQHLADREMTTLSGGERRRVHLARILAQLDNDRPGATLMLLDEPLNDLDIKHQLSILAIARDHAHAGHCVVAVLHDVGLAQRFADRVLLMERGRIVGQGTPADVLTAERLTSLYGVQASIHRHPETGVPQVSFGITAPDLQYAQSASALVP